MIPKERYGVHQSHCCVYHGCKYGDEDCPVAIGEIVQDHGCEYCPTYFDPKITHSVVLTKEQFVPIKEGKQTYFIFDSNKYQINKGQAIIFKNDENLVHRIVSQVDTSEYIKNGYSIASFNDDTHNIEASWY